MRAACNPPAPDRMHLCCAAAHTPTSHRWREPPRHTSPELRLPACLPASLRPRRAARNKGKFRSASLRAPASVIKVSWESSDTYCACGKPPLTALSQGGPFRFVATRVNATGADGAPLLGLAEEERFFAAFDEEVRHPVVPPMRSHPHY